MPDLFDRFGIADEDEREGDLFDRFDVAADAGQQRRNRVDAIAQERFGKPFAELSQHERRVLGADPSLIGQSVWFGTLDEAVAGADALAQGAGNLFRRATGRDIETTMGEAYRRSHDLQNTALEQRRNEQPLRSAATEALGAFAVGPARAAGAVGMQAIQQGARAITPAATRAEALLRTGANVVRGSAAGSAGAAAYGAGTADDGERLQGALRGATLGAFTGAAVPLATSTGGALVRRIRQPRADRQLVQAGQRAGIGDNLDDALRSARPDDFVAEAVGGSAARRARGISGVSEDAAEVVRDAVSDRQSRRFDRLMQGVRAVAEDDGTRAATRNVTQMRQMAKPLFDQVDENVITPTAQIREHVRNLRRANVSFRRADELAGVTGSGRVRLSALADDMDLPNEVRLGDLRALIAQAEDDAGVAFRAGRGQMGTALSDRARALRNALKEVDPRFREASRLWHSAAQDQRAIELGRDVFSGRAGAVDELREFVEGGMSATERQGFLEGVTQAFEARAARAAEDGGNAAARFNPRYIRDRLRLVFGDDADQITSLLNDLNAQAEFEYRALRNVNSLSADRIEATRAAQNSLRTGLGDAVRDIRNTVALTKPRAALADIIDGTPDEQATRLAQLLFRPADANDPDLQRLLGAYQHRRGLYGRAAPDTLPAYAGAASVAASD